MKLAATTHGDGPRRIGLVHGLGADGAPWQGLTERLVALGDTSVITVDLRGHGESGRSRPYSIAAFADDVVESLPAGLDAVAGHSLGGAVLERAVARLAPRSAVYFDPGFALPLPTEGWRARVFWATAPVGLTVAALAQKRKAKGRPPYSAADAALRDRARDRFDKSMAVEVFRDITYHPAPIAAPRCPRRWCSPTTPPPSPPICWCRSSRRSGGECAASPPSVTTSGSKTPRRHSPRPATCSRGRPPRIRGARALSAHVFGIRDRKFARGCGEGTRTPRGRGRQRGADAGKARGRRA